MKKPGRNDPCPCGSGKKFKKCCESRMIGKKFMAQKIEKNEGKEKNNMFSIFKKFVKKSNNDSQNKDEKS